MEKLLGYIPLKALFSHVLWTECVGEQNLGGATLKIIKEDLL